VVVVVVVPGSTVVVLVVVELELVVVVVDGSQLPISTGNASPDIIVTPGIE